MSTAEEKLADGPVNGKEAGSSPSNKKVTNGSTSKDDKDNGKEDGSSPKKPKKKKKEEKEEREKDKSSSSLKNGKEKPAKKMSLTTEEDTAVVANDDEPSSEVSEEVALCKIILEAMEAHENGWPFLEPVNTKHFPTYRKIIKKPMDIYTIKTKFDSNR